MISTGSFSADTESSGPRPPKFTRTSRVTRGGRHLHYQLRILQQPERARACGAGTRANSDRRPVDPPPVVELKIVSGNSFEEGTDITFDYEANFFLYASLEPAREIAQGRVQSQPNPPILTGVPASGMAYLDKPEQAGYFIFPDLSVRHEGRYVLSFSLFETTKNQQDFDSSIGDDVTMPDGVDWRMEIRTQAFSVYSAKRFPGLKESTELSRTVSEQGCRVRIRREIRMRKKQGTKKGDDGRPEDDNSARRHVTPNSADPSNAAAAARNRSISNASDARMPYMDQQRRASAIDAYGPPRPHEANSRNMSFGGHSAAPYSIPPQYAPAPQSVGPISPEAPCTPHGSMMRPERIIHPSPHHIRPERQPYGYAQARSVGRPSQSPIIKPDMSDHRLSKQYPTPAPSAASNDLNRRDSYGSYPPTPTSHGHSRSATSSKLMTIDSLLSADNQRAGAMGTYGAGGGTPSGLDSRTLRPIQPDSYPYATEPCPMTGEKRKHSRTFAENLQPLHSGQRPQELTSMKDGRDMIFTSASGERLLAMPFLLNNPEPRGSRSYYPPLAPSR